MLLTRKELPISFLDDFSYNLNDSRKFVDMVNSAQGLPDGSQLKLAGDSKNKILPRVVDPMKRVVQFTLDKLNEEVGKGDYADVSEGYVRAFKFKYPRQDFDNKRRYANQNYIYLWRDGSDNVQHLLCARGEWRQNKHESKKFRDWTHTSLELSDLLGALDMWSKNFLDEDTILEDLNAFWFKEVPAPSFEVPVKTRSYPNVVYEGELQYVSGRDVHNKPIVRPVPHGMVVVKKVKVSVQLYDNGRMQPMLICYKNK